MKKLFALTILFFCFSFGFSQVPKGFNYQAILRDASGKSKANKTVNFRFTILFTYTNSISTTVYQETQNTTTNEFGLTNLIIGNGVITIPGLTEVVLSKVGNYYLNVELDTSGNSNYFFQNRTQLVSVPFSIVADRALTTNQWTNNGATNVVLNNNIADNVGIGTITPQAKLEVFENGTTNAAIIASNSSAGATINATNTNLISSTATGVLGTSNKGYGVNGVGFIGVYGLTDNTNGDGIYGYASNTSGQANAIHGNAVSSKSVAGFFENTGGGYAIKTNGGESINDGHIDIHQFAPPTIKSLTSIVPNTSSSLQMISSSTDVAGSFSIPINTGASIASSSIGMVKISFNKAFSTPPVVIITPANENALEVQKACGFYINSSNNDFTLFYGTCASIPRSGSTHNFNYVVIGTY